MLFLGVDPGVRLSVFALIDRQCRLLRVGVVKTLDQHSPFTGMVRSFSVAASTFPEVAIAVVEGQQVYKGKTVAASILPVAHTAGAIGALLVPVACRVLIPLPATWKGQVPKEVNQARSLARVGLQYVLGTSYCWPSGCATAAKVDGLAQLNRGDWEHVGDAVGLALWGLDVHEGRKHT